MLPKFQNNHQIQKDVFINHPKPNDLNPWGFQLAFPQLGVRIPDFWTTKGLLDPSKGELCLLQRWDGDRGADTPFSPPWHDVNRHGANVGSAVFGSQLVGAMVLGWGGDSPLKVWKVAYIFLHHYTVHLERNGTPMEAASLPFFLPDKKKHQQKGDVYIDVWWRLKTCGTKTYFFGPCLFASYIFNDWHCGIWDIKWNPGLLKINHQTIGIKEAGLPELAVSSTCKTLHLFFWGDREAHINLKGPPWCYQFNPKRHC